MSDIQILNDRFVTGTHVRFEKLAGGVTVAIIDNPLATATISLYGGHIVSWRPKHQIEPVLWVSKLAQFKLGKAIRGGVPICWPWFGSHPAQAKLPAHGYARISPWDVISVRELDKGATEVMLMLSDTDLSRDHGPRAVRLSIRVTVGARLEVALTTANDSNQSIVLSEGLHTYFKVGHVNRVSVLGLEGSEYVDLIRDNLRCQQVGPVKFDGELGRIYVSNQSVCVIDDPLLRRRIRVEKSGSCSTAVWNPWTLTASKMDDLGSEGWRDMVCVESANALENQVTVTAGNSHIFS
jgi:D-hexose-6-phosphate mutarotase